MASSSSGKRPSAGEWLKHKFTIERMFVEEKKSLAEIRQRLGTEGLLVSKAQLEYKLKLWGLRRRIPKTKGDVVWQFIGRRVQRRKQQGKETEVMVGKQIFDSAKVSKEIKRYQDTTVARFSQPSPITPEGLDISLSTPVPLPMRFLWPTSLPWSRFQENFPLVFSAPGLLENKSKTSNTVGCRKEDLSLKIMLRLIAAQSESGCSVTQLAAEIGSIMPQTHENEIFSQASRLLQGPADERYSEYVRIMFYKISNNFFPFDDITKYINRRRRKTSSDVSYTEWENIIQTLETSGIMKAPLKLEHITDATLAAVKEKIFQHVIRQIEWEWILPDNTLEKFRYDRIIDWLLQSGQSPNVRITRYQDGHNIYGETPLQIAAHMRSLQLMSQLMDYGACPDLSYKLWDEFDDCLTAEGIHPLLEIALHYEDFDEGRLAMFERLLKMSSTVAVDSIIRMMMRCGPYFPELMEALISNGADIFQSINATSDAAWFIDTFSIIGYTVKYSCKRKELHPFFRLLEDAGVQNRFQIPETVDTTNIVLLAAAEGNTGLLEGLHNYGIDITARGSLGSSAIHVAAYYGKLETCKRLVLEHRALVDAFEFNNQVPSPLHFAVAGDNLAIVRLFHQSKIDVNKAFEDQQGKWSAFLALDEEHDDTWLYRSFTAVEVALELFSDSITQYLLENGARAPPWGAYHITCHQRHDTTEQELSKLALKAGADPCWGVCKSFSTWPVSINSQFQEALWCGDAVLAQQLVLDAREDDLWIDSHMSVLEAATIASHEQTMEKTFPQSPGAYDPGALCAKVVSYASCTDSINIRELLSNRPQSEETLPSEALAIGLAAWSGQTEVLKLLLDEFGQPMLAKASEALRYGLPRLNTFEFAMDGLPFWYRSDGLDMSLRSISPTIFALKSREALSLMLNHGYKPDRSTMRVAINNFDPDILKMLMKFPRLSDCSDHIQGPLSYAVMYKMYDVVRFLLENGEDVNEDNYHVFTDYRESARSPLQSAVQNSDLYLIDLLLQSGADVNTPAARRGGATALQLAAITGRLGILRTLIDHGADVNAPGAEFEGRTALEGAAEHGRIDTIQYLLSIGARTTDRDRLQYLRAIRYAQTKAHEVAAELLRGHREWAADDHILWTALEGLSWMELEHCKEMTQELSPILNILGDNMELTDDGVETALTKDDSDHLRPKEDFYDPTEGMEPPDDLQDLEMRTNDPMMFMKWGV